MELQLQELLDQIKKNGVEAAEAEAAAIVAKAKADAEEILARAKAEADKLRLQAKEEADRFASAGEEAIRQAGRNLLLSFRESVAKELQAVTGEAVTAALAPEALSALILQAVAAWTADTDASGIAVLLGADDLRALESGLLAALRERLLTGVTLRSGDGFDGGFRIAVQEGRAYYDYSAKAVTDMLAAYLSPRVTALLKEAEHA